jgi:hypothetical protein
MTTSNPDDRHGATPALRPRSSRLKVSAAVVVGALCAALVGGATPTDPARPASTSPWPAMTG